MLIKVNNRLWENFNCVNSLRLQRCKFGSDNDVYIAYICVDGKEMEYNRYDSREGAIEDMNELSSKINAAQGFKANDENSAMQYVGHGDEPGISIYRCSRCKTNVQAYDLYNYCPYCGRKVKEWK